MPLCLVSLGSNLGDPAEALGTAQRLLGKTTGFDGVRFSQRHATAPVGGPEGQGGFLNAAATFQTDLPAAEVLAVLQRVEASLSRERHERWAARTLDVDLLLYGEASIRTPTLTVPHPRMSFRPFVLEPAVELAGGWVHPEIGARLDSLLSTLRTGRDALAIAAEGHAGRSLAALVRSEYPGGLPAIVDHNPADPATKLVVDARPTGAGPLDPPGPRLALRDAPAEHWRAEVRAAIACVWPRLGQ